MNKIKLDIISGFLGAGKTTFIKKLVSDLYQEEKVVILENEFGRINIDEETLDREGLIVQPIQAGCICCSSSMNLYQGIFEIIEHYGPDRIIIEPTGIAKLSEIKRLLNKKEINELCEVEHIVTIVDGKNYRRRTMISKEFFEDQIRTSEVIFLSRTDAMQVEEIQTVRLEISNIQPSCRIIDNPWSLISPQDLKRYMELKLNEEAVKHRISLRKSSYNDYESLEILFERKIDIDRVNLLIKEIESNKYGEIHRLKGVCTDFGDKYYSIEYVPGEVNIKILTYENTRNELTRLCLIGRNLEKNQLKSFFQLI